MGGMRNWELGIGKWFNRVCNPVNHANPRNPGFYHLPLLIGGQAGGYGNPTMVSLELKDGDKLTVFFFNRNGFSEDWTVFSGFGY